MQRHSYGKQAVFMIGSMVVLEGLSIFLFGPHSRWNRRSKKEAEVDKLDRPPVRDEDRLIEPLGAGNPWGELTQIDSRYKNIPFQLTRQYIILGRQLGCDIVIEDERASRYHVVMAWDHGRAYIRDNSLNGTRVNGVLVQGPLILRHGDMIEAAGVQYRFGYTEASGQLTPTDQFTERLALPTAAIPEHPALVGRLIALTGPEPQRVWPIFKDVVGIGRDSDNMIVLLHPSISRHHAQIIVQPGGSYIMDIGSSNGTSVNGSVLTEPHHLRDGDHVQIGDILLVFNAEQPIPPPAPPEDVPTQVISTANILAAQAETSTINDHYSTMPRQFQQRPFSRPLTASEKANQPQSAEGGERKVTRFQSTHPLNKTVPNSDDDPPTV